MKRKDALRGIENCMLTVQHIIQGYELESCNEQQIKERMEHKFRHEIAGFISKSDKLQIEKREDSFDTLSQDVICRATVYVFNHNELVTLIDNVKMKVWEDMRSLQSLILADELDKDQLTLSKE